MKKELLKTKIKYVTKSGKAFLIPLSYQLFGKKLFTAPIILVNHALTGNSDVTGENGWWKYLIGSNQTIDTNNYTVICFNIPGNGYDDVLINNYKDITTTDIASIFLKGLEALNIKHLFAIIGGSIGGAIGWEMLVKSPKITENFIPIASDYKTSDWLHAQCQVQKYLLKSKKKALQKARIHAMLCYRTPESLNLRFKKKYNVEKQILESQSWLSYHGEKLNERFSLKAYKLMNHLLTTISTTDKQIIKIKAHIHLISVNSDLFFPASEIITCYDFLKVQKKDVFYDEIQSIHGHDAFLIEYEQLNDILRPIF